jgi:hypothetical protein
MGDLGMLICWRCGNLNCGKAWTVKRNRLNDTLWSNVDEYDPR